MKCTSSCRWIVLTCILIGASFASAEAVRLPQSPALSPDGRTLAFSWRGDIWSVPVKGGAAKRLTQHGAVESSPSFSPDGKQIAFTSDRERSRQVYVMPAEGGESKQMSWHTEGYDIEEWLPDGKGLLVSITRDQSWTSRSARLALLDLSVRRAEDVVFDDYAYDGSVSPDGKRVLFTREGESWWRQGYHGSRAGQIWLFNREDGSFKQIKGESTECRWPHWKPDGKGFYYVSNRDGCYNFWEYDLDSGKDVQHTTFKTDSVVFPTVSRDGSMVVFRHLFDLYRWSPGSNSPPEKIDIQSVGDATDSPVDRLVLEKATEITSTPDGLQFAFIAGGDVWVMDTELREPHQVTHTAEEERSVVFAPDGKSLVFVSDAGGQTDLWSATPERPSKYWWENHNFTLKRITNDAAAESRAQFTRDGKHIAFLKERGDLWYADADGQNAKRLLESWDAPRFDFSPDGAWIVYSRADEWFNSDIWLLPVNGSQPPFNLSRHPGIDTEPVWSPDGKMIAWSGKRGTNEMNIFYVWLRAEDDERTRRERTLVKAREKIAKAATAPTTTVRRMGTTTGTSSARPTPAAGSSPSGTAPASSPPPAPNPEPATSSPAPSPSPAPTPPKPIETPPATPVQIDLEDIHERIRHITLPTNAESGLLWSPDSKKLAFNAPSDGKRATFTIDLVDESKPKLLVPMAGSDMTWLKFDDQIICLNEGVPTSISLKGTTLSYRFRAQQSSVRSDKQRAVFDECWRVMRDRYYDERLGNRDWISVRSKYSDMAAAAPDMRGVVDVVHMMLGELNGSHLGFSLNIPLTTSMSWREETAHLGLRFDPSFAGPGWKVRDVLPTGPASHRLTKIEPGEIILRIDSHELRPGMDISEVLNGSLERDISLQVKSSAGATRDVTLRPISYLAARKLLYDQWIKDSRNSVEKASNGKLGYLHISAMNDASFEKFQEELYAAGAGKDGLVIDVRENGGGSTADHLLTALSQPRHAITVPRGGSRGYPEDRIVYAIWNKPIAVLCNQNSFSNAEIFCHAIKTLKRGPLIGVPTAGGVISTGATRIMDVGLLRLPFRGWYVMGSGEDMELNGAKPDHLIWPAPGDMPKGIDAQLQKAIEVLKNDVANWKQQSEPKLIKASERKPQ